ncbi:major facilitator superfamily domain-containing protein 6-like [Amphiura filiformis]|uniref:major facilitator superfamily domain-containing protein 6-like n=1 Tax=Amphiura filiformis TaxID=82378 RepID=UPI003B20BDBC
MELFHMNHRMLPYKLFYFFFFSGMSITPFMSVYFKQLGMNASQIGIVSAARPVAVALFQPVSGFLTDKWQCPKITVVLGGAAWIGSAFVMGIAYPKPQQKSCTVIHDDLTVMQSNFSLISATAVRKTNSNIAESAANVSTLISSPKYGFLNSDDFLEDKSWLYTTDSVRRIVYIFVIAYALFGLGYVPLHSIADAESVNTLQEMDIDMAEYGRQRAFGSLGWGLAPLIFGMWMTISTGSVNICGITFTNTDFRPMFVVFVGFALGAVISMAFFSYKWHAENKEETKGFEKGILLQLCSVPNMAVLLVMTFIGVCNGTVQGYLYWHLDNIGASELIMALASLCHSISEFLLGLVTGAATRQFGYFPLMTVGILTYLFRFIIYAYIKQPWWILGSELLHSLTFLLTWNTALSYLSLVIPQEFRTSLASLLNALYLGLGNAIGYLMGGYLIDAYGSVATFHMHTFACGVVATLFVDSIYDN